jgi:uncharacterized repeat protein (TIGR01451 family)
MRLAAGHYKALVFGANAAGVWVALDKAKSTVFTVACPTPPGTTGTVTVTKALAEGSQPAGQTRFAVTVSCATAGYAKTFALAVGESATTSALPAGTGCTVTEAPTPGWDAPTFTPSATLTVPAGARAAVRVVNNKPAPPRAHTGTVTVTKALAEGSQPAGETRFAVTVSCATAGYAKTFALAVGESATTSALPAGAGCTVTEAPTPGWDAPTFTPSATLTVPACRTATVLVVNNKPAAPPRVADLTLAKANSPHGAVSPGDVIAYTLTVTAGGTVSQDGVVVSDVVPAGTTYVSGSAACVPAGHLPCVVGYAAGTRTVTFSVGAMAPADQLQVTFAARVDATVPLTTTITNVGTVASARAKATSNKVTNPLVAVLGEKLTRPGTGLAATGVLAPFGVLLALGAGLLLAGPVLLATARRRPRRR